jgi:hypothetical protein
MRVIIALSRITLLCRPVFNPVSPVAARERRPRSTARAGINRPSKIPAFEAKEESDG